MYRFDPVSFYIELIKLGLMNIKNEPSRIYEINHSFFSTLYTLYNLQYIQASSIYKNCLLPVQLVSIFLMILITVVYLILPNLKSVHRKCCICYFICSSLGISLFIVGNMHWVDPEDGKLICYFVGNFYEFNIVILVNKCL